MTSLLEYALREEYTRVEKLGDKLSQIDTLIDWSVFRSIVKDMYANKSKKGGRPNTDEIVYRDRGYSGTETKGYNATMKKGARNHPIDIRDKLRNKRISRKRAPGERPYAVIKNVFKSSGSYLKIQEIMRKSRVVGHKYKKKE